MRSIIVVALLVAGCGSGGNSPTKKVSADGTTCCIVSDATNMHVAYLLNAPTVIGSVGELHVAGPDGTDVKVASGVASGGFLFPPKGGPDVLLFTQLNSGGKDGSLSMLDLSKPGQQPKVLFPTGMRTSPITLGEPRSAQWMTPLGQQGFFTPSGKYFVVGVLAPNVANSPDLHTIDLSTGADVFVRPNGAFDYLEAALPDDTMLFQDSVGGSMGPTGPPPVQTLFYVSLPSGTPTTIDTRTGFIAISPDNKNVVYSKIDHSLFAWDPTSKSAKKLTADGIAFAVAGGKVGFISADHSFHVVGADGSAVLDVPAATAQADWLGPVVVSADGSDAYWFSGVEVQNARGTLWHVATAAGATPSMIAQKASINDVRPIAGALLYLDGVDDVGQFGSAHRAARDGSGAMALSSGVPVGGLLPISPPMPIPSTTWVCPHLSGATIDRDRRFIDVAATEPVGALMLTTMTASADVMVDASTRAGQFVVSDDQATLAYVGGVILDPSLNNYAGSLKSVPVAMPTMSSMALVAGVTEVGPVVGKAGFANAPKAGKPGVYYIKY